jgi:hypothetical protein
LRYFYNLKPSHGRPRERSYFSQYATLGRRNRAFLADLTRGWAFFHMFLIKDGRKSRFLWQTLLSFSAMRQNNSAFVMTFAKLFTFGDLFEHSCQSGLTSWLTRNSYAICYYGRPWRSNEK